MQDGGISQQDIENAAAGTQFFVRLAIWGFKSNPDKKMNNGCGENDGDVLWLASHHAENNYHEICWNFFHVLICNNER